MEEQLRQDAISYLRGKDRFEEVTGEDRQEIRAINRAQYFNFVELSGIAVLYVDEDPYTSINEMKYEILSEGVLRIYNGDNNSRLLPGIHNLWQRAAHDIIHYWLGAPFTYEGELQVYEIQKLDYPSKYWPILYSEICMQAAYCEYYGNFPDKQKIVIP